MFAPGPQRARASHPTQNSELAAPDHAGHIWYYELSLDGVLTPQRAPILVDGRNIRHEGPDTLDGAADLDQLRKLPDFSRIMGPDTALFDTVTQHARPAGAVPQ